MIRTRLLVALSTLASGSGSYRFRAAHAGLALAFPELPPRALAALTRRHLRRFYRSILDVEAFAKMRPALRRTLVERVEIAQRQHFDAAVARSRGIVLVTPHVGNVLLSSAAFAAMYGDRTPRAILYDSASRNADSDLLRATFDADGWRSIFADRGGLREALTLLRDGGLVTVMPDICGYSKSTLYVPFFGRMTLAMPGAAYLAHRTGAPVLPIYGWGDERGSYRLAFDRAIEPGTEGDPERAVFDITAEIYGSLERALREAPEVWAYWGQLADRCVRTPAVTSSASDLAPVLRALAERLEDTSLSAAVARLAASVA